MGLALRPPNPVHDCEACTTSRATTVLPHDVLDNGLPRWFFENPLRVTPFCMFEPSFDTPCLDFLDMGMGGRMLISVVSVGHTQKFETLRCTCCKMTGNPQPNQAHTTQHYKCSLQVWHSGPDIQTLNLKDWRPEGL